MARYLVTVYESLVIRDADRNYVGVRLADGECMVEEMTNPTGGDVPWLVLVGTRRGAARSWWLDMERQQLVELINVP